MSWDLIIVSAVLITATTILGVIAAFLVAAAFYVGARSQEKLGVLFKINTERAMKKQQYDPPPTAGWGPDLHEKGSEHPNGPPPPMPEEVRRSQRKNPLDWLKTGSKLNVGG